MPEDSEDVDIPFLRAFLPGGPLLDLSTPASQVHLKPVGSSVGTVLNSQPGRLQAMKQPGKSRSSISRLGSPFPGRCMLLCWHLAVVQSISSQCPGGALAEQSPEDAQ